MKILFWIHLIFIKPHDIGSLTVIISNFQLDKFSNFHHLYKEAYEVLICYDVTKFFASKNVNYNPNIDRIDIEITNATNNVLNNIDLKVNSKNFELTIEIKTYLENKKQALLKILNNYMKFENSINFFEILAQKSSKQFFKRIVDILFFEYYTYFEGLKIKLITEEIFKSFKPNINEILIIMIVKKTIFWDLNFKNFTAPNANTYLYDLNCNFDFINKHVNTSKESFIVFF